jgi:hypothetical protein
MTIEPQINQRLIEPDGTLTLEGYALLKSFYDEFIVNSNSLVLKSPDGTRWAITVDNSGTISTTSL